MLVPGTVEQHLAEFRVWLAGEDLYYVMFEKNEQRGESAEAEPAVESDVEQPESPVSAGDSAVVETQHRQPDQQQQQLQQVSSSLQQPQKRKKLRRSQRKKLAVAAVAAAAADGDLSDEAAAAAAYSRRKFTRVRIDEFPVASELICALMPLLRHELISKPVLREKLFQANFHTTLSKEAIISLTYRSTLDDVWQVNSRSLALLGKSYVVEYLSLISSPVRPVCPP